MTSDSKVIRGDSRDVPGHDLLGDGVPDLGDSKWLVPQSAKTRLQVYEAGKVTVVGFGGHDVPSEYCIAESRELLARLIRENDCDELIFDLTGVRMIPSGMLGVLASMKHLCATVSVCNPSPDIREVLATTQLEKIIHIREVEI